MGTSSRSAITRPTLSSTTRSRPGVSTTSARGATAEPAAKKSRPGWDIKGKFEDLEAFTKKLGAQLELATQKIENLNTQVQEREVKLSEEVTTKTVLAQEVSVRQHEVEEAARNLRELRTLLETQKFNHKQDKMEWERKLSSLTMENESLHVKLQVTEQEVHRLLMSTNKQAVQIETQNTEIAELKNRDETNKSRIATLEGIVEDFKASERELKELVAELEGKAREHEMLRRKLHNTIQELKGNIRVFCRVRPLLGEEKNPENVSTNPFNYPPNCDNKNIDVAQGGREAVAGGQKHAGSTLNFSFDRVFGPSSTQSEVFEEISQLVQSALDGYNTCIFTYGQTGSGKTFTMEGPGKGMADLGLEGADHENRGMIPRAVEQIFKTAKKLQEQGWEYSMDAFFLEIYNEKIRDLLRPKSETKGIEFEIKHDNKGCTTVTNLSTVRVEAPHQVYDLLKRAARHRSTGSTKMNERSSRSHSVFHLRLSGINKINGKTSSGVLNLIDLAGSERLSASGATGERLEETKHINKSLTCLGDVIYSLASRAKGAHIPYRNSKLTYLLQNYLGGNSKTLMFVNVSPLARDLSETVSSLRFATKVNSCDIGTAKRNMAAK